MNNMGKFSDKRIATTGELNRNIQYANEIEISTNVLERYINGTQNNKKLALKEVDKIYNRVLNIRTNNGQTTIPSY